MSAAQEHAFRYAGASEVRTGPTPSLRLVPSLGHGPTAFFDGQLRDAAEVARALLFLYRVADSRFHVPAAMLAGLIRAADPVFTCAHARMRIESFSRCASAYARVDLRDGALDGELLGRGTTNVDFNPPMRAALARVTGGPSLGLRVAADGVDVRTDEHEINEQKVALPLRWLRGFVEVQAVQRRMTLAHAIRAAEARRFVAGLPRTTTRGDAWLVAAGRGVRLARRATRGALQIAGIERLRVLEPVLRDATELRVYGEPGGASAWEAYTPDRSVTLVLSPAVWRGFSGEGQVLEALASPVDEQTVAQVRARLRWDATIDHGALAVDGVTAAEVDAALAALGTSGLVGYDAGEGAWFQRELPFDTSTVDRLHPRYRGAQKLVGRGERPGDSTG